MKTYVRHGSCEDDQLVVLAELIEELDSTRSDQIVALLVLILGVLVAFEMDESLIQVKHKCVCAIPLLFSQWR